MTRKRTHSLVAGAGGAVPVACWVPVAQTSRPWKAADRSRNSVCSSVATWASSAVISGTRVSWAQSRSVSENGQPPTVKRVYPRAG
ncbi:hypothetical protein [Streptacidiphilus sp. P02-A3a]|uniref:hypothetical protein n=1 Tax=Streptacidiphilus sp. P02-A3a TaxID=2704468 RepID=UPI001CDD0557|nr:hypothetical protein [Streptacidiphilus sp. P02-A3a]